MLESLGQAIRGAAFAIPGALGVQEGGYLLLAPLVGLPRERRWLCRWQSARASSCWGSRVFCICIRQTRASSRAAGGAPHLE